MSFAILSFLAVFLAGTANAQADKAGVFDYYVLALSWQPTWCMREGDARGAPECEDGTARGWTLHGLWPQYERGWPSECPTTAANPTRRQTAAMADLMGSSGLAWYQWRKHGRCSGLSAGDYFALARLAWDRVTRPPVFRALDEPVRLPPSVVEEAWLQANPDLTADMITVTCRESYIHEVRICLDRSLEPRICAPDTRRDCSQEWGLLAPIR